MLLNCNILNHKIRSHYGISFEDYLLKFPSSSLLFELSKSLYKSNDIKLLLINNGNSIIVKGQLFSYQLT